MPKGPWKAETPAKQAEQLARRLEARAIGRRIWNGSKLFEGSDYDIRSVTGQDPITEDD